MRHDATRVLFLLSAAGALTLLVSPVAAGAATPSKNSLPSSAAIDPTPATSAADCTAGYTCFYGDGGFSGWLARYTDVQTTNIPYPNQMSSWINRNSHAATWFTGANGTGTGHCVLPSIEVSQVKGNENDTMVSFKILSGTTC